MEQLDNTDGKRLDKLEVTVEKITAAFPGGDFSGHARYHEAVIQDLADRRSMRKAIVEKVITGSVWALAFGLFTACVAYLKDHVFTLIK